MHFQKFPKMERGVGGGRPGTPLAHNNKHNFRRERVSTFLSLAAIPPPRRRLSLLFRVSFLVRLQGWVLLSEDPGSSFLHFIMSEDRQPNDLRGRNTTVGIPSIRPARNIPQSRDSPSSARTSFKRPFDRSYTASPAKRRRLEFEPAQREIRRELPPACRKGVPDCHRQRKLFIIHEIECLQKSRLGLTVVSHSVKDGAVFFLCTQADILNCSLAPSSTLNEIPQKEHIQPKVSLFSLGLCCDL